MLLLSRFYGTILIILITTACATVGMNTKPVIMTEPVLAKLQIPEKTLLLYENMAIANSDRTGNWRFLFRNDGCFFNARNTQLWITDPEALSSNDPKFYWNTAFPNTPNRCLTDSQKTELADAIRKSDFASLAKHSPFLGNQRVSDSSIERWTLVEDSGNYTVLVEKGFAPPQLVQMRAKIDQLIANATRTQ
jgi:hypothetical protein